MKTYLLILIFAIVLASCQISNKTQDENSDNLPLDTISSVVDVEDDVYKDTIILQKNLYMNTSCGEIRYHRYLVSPERNSCILVLYLHGGCSVHAGDPLELEHGDKHIVNYLKDKKQAAIVLFPIYTQRTGNWSNMFSGLKDLIDAHLGVPANSGVEAEAQVRKLLGEEYSMQVVPDEIFVTGTSDGGAGTYGMIAQYPELFNTAMPVAAGWNRPLHESRMIVVVENRNYNRTIAENVSAMENVKYECQGENHGACCQQAYTSDRLDWFFKCNK